MSDQSDVLAANNAFYEAFATSNLGAMDEQWAREASVVCLHPGWNALHTREEIVASWAGILGNGGGPEIRCEAANAHVHGDMAFVVCNEVLPGATLAATNVFIREQGEWRICHHHAGPIPQPRQEELSRESLN